MNLILKELHDSTFIADMSLQWFCSILHELEALLCGCGMVGDEASQEIPFIWKLCDGGQAVYIRAASVGWDHLRGFIANHATTTQQDLKLIDHALNPLKRRVRSNLSHAALQDEILEPGDMLSQIVHDYDTHLWFQQKQHVAGIGTI